MKNYLKIQFGAIYILIRKIPLSISRLKTLEKKFLTAMESKDSTVAKEASSAFISALEKARKTSLVHANKIARKKSRCAALLAYLSN